MKWVLIALIAVVAIVVAVAIIGSMLPRNHVASRTLSVRRPPADVWPAVLQATSSSSVAVDILEKDPPRRLVTRVTEQEKNFGGTWTIAIAPASTGSTVTVTEDGWVANPIFRFVSRYVMGHHATMDGVLTDVAKSLNEPPALSGE